MRHAPKGVLREGRIARIGQGGIVPEEQERNEPLWMSFIYKYQAGELDPRNKSKMSMIFVEGAGRKGRLGEEGGERRIAHGEYLGMTGNNKGKGRNLAAVPCLR